MYPIPPSKTKTAPVIPFLTFIRLVFNLNLRMVYPFLTVFARGLGVDLATLGTILSIRALMGLVATLIAPIADRRGRKVGIALSLGLFLLGTGAMVLFPGLPGFIAANFLGYIGSFIFLPTVQAYLADTIPYEGRARASGLVELGWSLAFILGMPVFGLLIQRFGWQAPFPFLVGLGVVALVVLWRFIPEPENRIPAESSWTGSLRQVFNSPAALAGLLLYLSLGMSGEVINLVFGAWMEASFGLKIAALGLASAVIGFAELGGETITVTIADRLGKERAVAAGLVINALVALALPWMGRTEVGALVGLFLFFLTFETTFVSSMPILAEILPSARATLTGINLAVLSIGRGAGTLISPLLFQYGFRANTIAVMVLNGVALLALLRIGLPRSAILPEEE